LRTNGRIQLGDDELARLAVMAGHPL
jgi:hypothetical protein